MSVAAGEVANLACIGRSGRSVTASTQQETQGKGYVGRGREGGEAYLLATDGEADGDQAAVTLIGRRSQSSNSRPAIRTLRIDAQARECVTEWWRPRCGGSFVARREGNELRVVVSLLWPARSVSLLRCLPRPLFLPLESLFLCTGGFDCPRTGQTLVCRNEAAEMTGMGRP